LGPKGQHVRGARAHIRQAHGSWRYRSGFSSRRLRARDTRQRGRAEERPPILLRKRRQADRGQQFSNLIDSYIHQTDDGLALTLVGLGALRGGGTTPLAGSIRTESNVGINEALPDTMLGLWADPALHPEMEPQWAGQHGFLPLKYQDAAGQPYYGFLQVSMESAVAPGAEGAVVVEPPAIFVEYWAWETTPNTTLTTFFVPEPASASAVALAGFVMLRRRRCARARSRHVTR
jgi:hypothetical protein